MTDMTKPYPGTQSVLRAVSILKAFDDDHPEWHLSQLARKVDLHKTTTFRILSALESEGLIMRNKASDSYVLGPEIIVMGGRALRSNNLRAISRIELEKLATDTGETASLEIMNGHEMVIIDEILGDHLVSGVRSIGTRWPVHGASTGLALLAFWPEEELNNFLEKPLPKITPKTITQPDDMRYYLRQVACQGYAVADEMLEKDLVAIGSPLIDYNECAIGAISIYGPKSRINENRFAEIGRMIHQSSLRISARLGYRPGDAFDFNG